MCVDRLFKGKISFSQFPVSWPINQKAYCEYTEYTHAHEDNLNVPISLPAFYDASIDLIKDKLQRSTAQKNPTLALYLHRLHCLSKGGNDGVMINTEHVWRSKSLSPAKINHNVSQNDGRHAFQLIEHAKGHRFFLERL